MTHMFIEDQTQYRLFDDPNNNGSTWSALGLSEGHLQEKNIQLKQN